METNMSDWQPIETAPHDLGEYIVAVDGRSRIAYNDGEGRFWNPDTGDRDVEFFDTTTHWLPLPDPPA